MKYIIMANGKGTRWNNYMGISKQEVIINGERLLDRIVRQIKERTDDKVFISSSNKNHENINAERIVSKYNDGNHQQYVYDYLDDETTYLYGDTYYMDEAMDIIINDSVDTINFYGNESAIVGIKVKNYELLKAVIDDMPDNCSIYHAFDFMSDKRKFISVGQTFYNINKPTDYEELFKKQFIYIKK